MYKQGNRTKCSGCGAYSGHSPTCPKIDFKEAKRLLSMYYESWLAFELQRRRNKPLLPVKDRVGATCWVYCPLCGRRRDEHYSRDSRVLANDLRRILKEGEDRRHWNKLDMVAYRLVLSGWTRFKEKKTK